MAVDDAVSHALGRHIRRHPWRATFDSAVMPIALGVIFVATGIVLLAAGGVLITFGIVAIAATKPLIELAIRSWRDRNNAFDVYERGIVVNYRGASHTWTWPDVQLQFNVERSKQVPSRVYHRHNLACGDMSVPVDDDFAEVAQLVREIDTSILDHQLDSAAHAIAAGESRTFGVLTIGKQGIDTPIVAMSWSQIASVDLRDGRVTIRRLGDGLTIAFSYAAVWNASIALALVRLGLSGAFVSDGPLRTSDLRRRIGEITDDTQRFVPAR